MLESTRLQKTILEFGFDFMLMAAIITFLNSSGHGIVTEQEESVGGSGGTAAIAVILRLLIQTVTG